MVDSDSNARSHKKYLKLFGLFVTNYNTHCQLKRNKKRAYYILSKIRQKYLSLV